jgi:hypothetical protein
MEEKARQIVVVQLLTPGHLQLQLIHRNLTNRLKKPVRRLHVSLGAYSR